MQVRPTETTPSSPDDIARTYTMDTPISKDSEKADDDLQADNASSIHGGEYDLEKATTHGSHGNHEPATRIATAADWTGPDDPGNPLTWSIWQKAYQTLAIGSLAFAVTAGSSLITPSVPEIAEHFGVSRVVAILPLTLYVLGLGLGPCIAAPISETYGSKFHRSPIMQMTH